MFPFLLFLSFSLSIVHNINFALFLKWLHLLLLLLPIPGSILLTTKIYISREQFSDKVNNALAAICKTIGIPAPNAVIRKFVIENSLLWLKGDLLLKIVRQCMYNQVCLTITEYIEPVANRFYVEVQQVKYDSSSSTPEFPTWLPVGEEVTDAEA